MSLKKLSLKKETLLPMNDDQAQTVAGGIQATIIPANAAGAPAICGGTVGRACSDPCTGATNCGTCATNCGTCATCATCATNCGTCATNCGCTQPTAVPRVCTDATCKTDCICPTIQPVKGPNMICAPY